MLISSTGMAKLPLLSRKLSLRARHRGQECVEQSSDNLRIDSSFEYPSEKRYADRFGFNLDPILPDSIYAKLGVHYPLFLDSKQSSIDTRSLVLSFSIHADDLHSSTADLFESTTFPASSRTKSNALPERSRHRDSRSTSDMLSTLSLRRGSNDSNNSSYSHTRPRSRRQSRLFSILPTTRRTSTQSLADLMLSACSSGDVPLIGCLIGAGVSVTKCTKDGLSPAHLAAAKGHLHALKCLALHGAKMNAVDVKGRTPLFAAVIAGQKTVIPFLVVESGIRGLSVRDTAGKTVMEYARLVDEEAAAAAAEAESKAAEEATLAEQRRNSGTDGAKENFTSIGSEERGAIRLGGIRDTVIRENRFSTLSSRTFGSSAASSSSSSSSSGWTWRCRSVEEILCHAADAEGFKI